MSDRPRLYSDLAGWFHLLTAPEDYAEEAATYRRIIDEFVKRPVNEVLELGSGGGNNASHLKAHYSLTLTDLSPEMIAISEELNPECEHIVGDMRSLRLGRDFDVVFAHDAVSYLLTEVDVRAAAETAYVHCRAGGVAIFIPDDTAEDFAPDLDDGGHDGDDGRGLRYLFWSGALDEDTHQYVSDAAYLLRSTDGSVQVIHDRHHLAAHPRATWLIALQDAGFEAHMVPWEHSEIDGEPMVLFVGIRA
ncbi:MAG: class I SAM-dependent methyltransferase [Acidimicrobiia bacterium]|nr:class I SAM-dependent methyltransferase [Acidimicrobiia bacterium]